MHKDTQGRKDQRSTFWISIKPSERHGFLLS